MKRILACVFAATLACSSKAQVEVLSPDFTLFGKNSGDYCAEWTQYFFTHSTNGDCLFPDADPLSDERVYFLQRPAFIDQTCGLQTYFVPDDVYVFTAIIGQSWDNVDVSPPFSPEQLRDLLRANVDSITTVRAVIDNVPLANPLAYRTESPFFSIYLPTTDNLYSYALGRPFPRVPPELVDPVVAGGYFIMLKPLPAGLHEVQTAYAFLPPNDLERKRHYQIYSLPVPQFLAYKTSDLAQMVSHSALAPNQQQPLLATLNAAQASLGSGRLRAAIGQVGAFQKIVGSHVARDDASLAGQLTQTAQKIIDKALAQLQ